jgi:hypothetical protein
MFIRYQIAPVGKKYGWRQGGPDCWYYTAKSLLRFYGLGNRNADEVWAHLQMAKLIRLFINGMRKIHGKDTHHPMLTSAAMSKWIDQEISNIESTRKEIVAQAQQELVDHVSLQALVESKENWTTERIANLCLVCKQLDGMLGRQDLSAISAKRYTFLKISQTIMNFDPRLRDKTWTTGEIFSSAFPPDLFQSVECKERTAAGLYDMLVKHGPLWTSGALKADEKSPYSIITPGETPDGDVTEHRVLVDSYVTGSHHAAVVYGVNTESGMVEYADPHDFQTPRRVNVATFFEHVRSFEFHSKSAHFLKVAAPNPDFILKSKKLDKW